MVEFIPYVLQLFAALLEANPSASLSDYYKSLIPPILTVDFWLSKGNVPALLRLLCSMISRGASEIAANNQVEPILGIFKQLVGTKTNEVYAFELLECVLSYFPRYGYFNLAVRKFGILIFKQRSFAELLCSNHADAPYEVTK